MTNTVTFGIQIGKSLSNFKTKSMNLEQRATTRIPISSIILDADIYPRKVINHRRVGMFAENIRGGFSFDPVEVEALPDMPGVYPQERIAKKVVQAREVIRDHLGAVERKIRGMPT